MEALDYQLNNLAVGELYKILVYVCENHKTDRTDKKEDKYANSLANNLICVKFTCEILGEMFRTKIYKADKALY